MTLPAKKPCRDEERGLCGLPRVDLPFDLSTKAATLAASLAVLTTVAAPQASLAADGKAIGLCLFKSCQVELARCVTNPSCLANLACINTCNGKADESACQIRCGDIFDNQVPRAAGRREAADR